MHYQVLHVTNLVAMANMCHNAQTCILLILWTNCINVRKKDTPSPISTILITGRQICQLLSSKLPSILPNIWQKMVAMVSLYRVNLMGKMKKNVYPSPISTIMIIENLACMCRSTSPLTITVILHNIPLIWLLWQLFLLTWYCTTPKYYLNFKTLLNSFVFKMLLSIIVVVTTSQCKNMADLAALIKLLDERVTQNTPPPLPQGFFVTLLPIIRKQQPKIMWGGGGHFDPPPGPRDTSGTFKLGIR